MDVQALLDRLVDEAPPPPPLAELERRVKHRRANRRAARLSCVALLAAAAVALPIALWAAGTSSSPSSVRVPPAAAPTPVPAGWKPVTFGPVQLAVPHAWPVYDSQCVDHSHDGVYLSMRVGQCPGSTLAGLTVEMIQYAGDASEFTSPPTDFHGLRAFTRHDTDASEVSYTVALPDQHVTIDMVGPASDATLVDAIVATIGPASNPSPLPGPTGPPGG